MVPSPIDSSGSFSPLPRSPTTPDDVKKKEKKTGKKSPRPVSPCSTGAVSPWSSRSSDEERRQKQLIEKPRKEKRQPNLPIAPPLSPAPSTPNNNNKGSIMNGNNSARSKNKPSSNRSMNRSITNRSPRTDSKHHQVANAAAEAASLRRFRRPRKRLRWNNSVRVKVISNLSNYSAQEKLDSWYWPDEYSMMEDECELTSIYMDEIAFEHENAIQEEEDSEIYQRHLPPGFCERGLESWTMHGEELKEQQVQLVIDTVWQAQIDAWEFLGNHPASPTKKKADDENGAVIECWEFIRERSSAVSRTCRLRAQKLGIMDEHAVDSYLNSVRSLELSRRRITKMLGGKDSRSSRSLTKAKSCRTLTTVASSGSASIYGNGNLKSILKSPRGKHTYSDMPPMSRVSSPHSSIPLKSGSDHGKDKNLGSFRVHLPKIGDDSWSLRSNSLRSNNASLRSSSLRSNSYRSTSLRNNSHRSNSLSGSLRSNSGSLRSSNSLNGSLRSNNGSLRSLRSNNGSLRSQLSPGTSSRSNSVRSNVSSSSFLSNTSKKIRYKPKSKIKIPTSPVGSVCNSVISNSNHNSITDEEDLSMRMMRSHMSIGESTEGSSRRRMLRATLPTLPTPPPL